MKDLFAETLQRYKEFNEALREAHIAQINENWDKFDEMTKTTFRVIYEDRVPQSR